MFVMSRRWIGLGVVGALVLAGCDEDDGRTPNSGTCAASDQCVSGLCVSNTCLDPEADDDQDGLLNALEAALGTDPFSIDTDGDSVSDRDELDENLANVDSDGDGIFDAVESATADADMDCLTDQVDPQNDVHNGATSPDLKSLCREMGQCIADGASLRVSCPVSPDAPACDYGDVPDFETDESSCDGLDNDCDGATDEADGCSSEDLPFECSDAFYNGLLDEGDRVTIDPDGAGSGGSVNVQCEMGAELGRWTPLVPEVTAALGGADAFEYLFEYEGAWIRSPKTDVQWTWTDYKAINGVWLFQDADENLGSFDCQNRQDGGYGVGCSTGPGDVPKVVASNSEGNAQSLAETQVCQNTLGAFGDTVNACYDGVTAYVRPLGCRPEADQMLGDASFDRLLGRDDTSCWYTFAKEGQGGFLGDTSDVRPGGSPPSLVVSNNRTDNDPNDVQIIQGDLTLVAGRRYSVSFWAKAETPRDVYVWVQDGNGSQLFETQALTTEWAEYTHRFVSPVTTYTAYFEIQFGQLDTADVWVDDISMVDEGRPPLR